MNPEHEEPHEVRLSRLYKRTISLGKLPHSKPLPLEEDQMKTLEYLRSLRKDGTRSL